VLLFITPVWTAADPANHLRHGEYAAGGFFKRDFGQGLHLCIILSFNAKMPQ